MSAPSAAVIPEVVRRSARRGAIATTGSRPSRCPRSHAGPGKRISAPALRPPRASTASVMRSTSRGSRRCPTAPRSTPVAAAPRSRRAAPPPAPRGPSSSTSATKRPAVGRVQGSATPLTAPRSRCRVRTRSRRARSVLMRVPALAQGRRRRRRVSRPARRTTAPSPRPDDRPGCGSAPRDAGGAGREADGLPARRGKPSSHAVPWRGRRRAAFRRGASGGPAAGSAWAESA